MTILCIARPPVKPTRHASRPDRPFGEGILPARRTYFVPSAEDLAWAAYELNKDATDYDVVSPTDSELTAMAWAEALGSELDRMAGEFEAQARMDAGYSLF
jgi:hypothetical protein